MSDRFAVEAGLDRTVVHIKRPPFLRHFQPVGLFGVGLLVAGPAIGTGRPELGGALTLLGIGALGIAGVLFRRTPPSHHRVELASSRLTVDGEPLDIGTLTLVITDEQVVFRDDARRVEIWHHIRRHADRMELRKVLEEAVDRARARHGDGTAEVPDALRTTSRARQ